MQSITEGRLPGSIDTATAAAELLPPPPAPTLRCRPAPCLCRQRRRSCQGWPTTLPPASLSPSSCGSTRRSTSEPSSVGSVCFSTGPVLPCSGCIVLDAPLLLICHLPVPKLPCPPGRVGSLYTSGDELMVAVTGAPLDPQVGVRQRQWPGAGTQPGMPPAASVPPPCWPAPVRLPWICLCSCTLSCHAVAQTDRVPVCGVCCCYCCAGLPCVFDI